MKFMRTRNMKLFFPSRVLSRFWLRMLIVFSSSQMAVAYTSCDDIRVDSPLDGEYSISIASSDGSSQTQTVFCYMMSYSVADPEAPYTYITLQSTADGHNVAQWVYGNVTLSTHFHKVRFDPPTMRILTGDLTFSSTVRTGTLNTEQYCNASTCDSGRRLPLRSAGCSVQHPDMVGVPYGMVGACISVSGASTACGFSNPPAVVSTVLDLTGTGLRLSDKNELNFLYPDDTTRASDFSKSGYMNAAQGDTVALTSSWSNNTLMNITVPIILDATDIALGFCKWVTNEQWLLGAFSGVDAVANLTNRSQAIRSGSATLCVCSSSDANATRCARSNCTYVASSFQLHYYDQSSATTCDFTRQFQDRDFTATSDRRCSALTDCNISYQYISARSTPTTDRECRNNDERIGAGSTPTTSPASIDREHGSRNPALVGALVAAGVLLAIGGGYAAYRRTRMAVHVDDSPDAKPPGASMLVSVSHAHTVNAGAPAAVYADPRSLASMSLVLTEDNYVADRPSVGETSLGPSVESTNALNQLVSTSPTYAGLGDALDDLDEDMYEVPQLQRHSDDTFGFGGDATA
eukprot:m.8139 g.8139  ORF g.8139 m.8139 type:complete len:577 (-) comp6112_c0_seq1:796-2526(-)